MNLPNKLTIFRILCIPVFVVLMLVNTIPYNNYIAVGVFIIASLTDMLDGKIARKYNLVTNFGKFNHKMVTLEPGLNIVYGENEAGKTTLHTFIRGMLFGIEKQRGKASGKDLYTKYEPWENPANYHGMMRIESDGVAYRIERNFNKLNKFFKVINEDEGVELKTEEIENLFAGLDESCYYNTISISQLGSVTDKELEVILKNYAANLGTTKSMEIDIKSAFADLDKQKKNMLDFSDVEHNALRVLVDSETKELTETALEYQQQYREVMIDEYQDSNYVQETLLTAVSGVKNGNENLFMVGDVKQSIYRFRLARPELFMDKYHRFSTEESSQQRIDLHRNFRSRREVVEAVNDIFYPLMEKDLGNVAYDAEAALYAGAVYPDYENADCCKPELLLVPSQESGMERREQEAAAVAGRIRELVETQEIPGITYKDIVLLLRSMSGWAETYQKVFEQEGIPLIVASKTGYFSATEVQTVLSLLRVLDNPYQDTPLAAVMKSYFGQFSSEELAQIRSEYPGMPFYQCVEQMLPVSEKIIAFQEMLQKFRQRIPYTPIHRLLQEILDETGYRNYVAALPAGEQRRANLDMLMEKAVAYEQTSYHGLFHFIRYIDRLMKYDVDYGEAEIVSEQENAVRLMSIHKSKGLEFPVVFVCGMGKQFNEQDLNSNMIFHPEFGIGLKWFDCEKRTKANTLIHQIFAMEAKKENLGEELRVLYVALTRAKEKLILAGTCKLPKEGQYSGFSREGKVPFSTRYDAKSYWDWVIPVLGMENPDYRYVIWDEARMQQEEQRKLQDTALEHRTLLEALQNVSEMELAQLKETFSWEYAWKEEGAHKQKVSVSELKHRAMEERSESAEQTLNTAQPLFPDEIATPYVPRFVQEVKENAGALYGTMVHRFLECLDFAGLPDFADEKQGLYSVKQQIDALCALGRMQEADAKRLNWKQLLGFLQSDTAKRMRAAAEQGALEREKPFVMSVPANLVWEDSRPEEDVLIQGIIDVFWEEADGIVLLDYKTDHVDNAQELVRRYKKQLELYADALSRFSDEKPVKEILIYSFALAETILL